MSLDNYGVGMIYRVFASVFIVIMILGCSSKDETWIRINQLGYLPQSVKVAVVLSKENLNYKKFVIRNALTDEIKYEGKKLTSYDKYLNFNQTYRLDFSEFSEPGAYYIETENIQSPIFRIGKDVYNGTADFLLNYMRQQRCGFNPYLQDSCHTHDGFRIYHPLDDSLFINVTGGWHDASDYLQYTTTSANATYQMLFAYKQNPGSFSDNFDESGDEEANGIPDILDEAKWGIDWLMKMNPSETEFYNQIADDRDHKSFRLPTEDSVDYGKGLERPVYLCTGEPQGVRKYKNRADGLASTLGKYSSSFSLASEVLKPFYPKLSDELEKRAINAYKVGKANPGVCQTAPCGAPYFYEEDNYTDDLELASMQLFQTTGEKKYLSDAVEFGRREVTTPWMGADSANHYQWYPFLNLGHYNLGSKGENYSDEFISYLKLGLQKIKDRGAGNPFQIGIPFIWCSNNLIAAALTQCRLYNQLTGDDTFIEMEASLRDWLFGNNPWGTSMIVGLPAWGDYPSNPHSAFWYKHGYQTLGGLVDGPVYASIYNRLIGITLYSRDEYSEFQNDYVVYHDDYGDYSTNEPTMDGTASLSFYLSAMQKLGSNSDNQKINYSLGGITRFDKSTKNIYLTFTGDKYADGAETITEVLDNYGIKANFFFTGNFYRNKNFIELIKNLVEKGHYIGAHSDKHLLYCDWDNRDSTLISHSEFIDDIKNNYKEMNKFGIETIDATYFLPAYEWYNSEISSWCKELGLQLVNYSQGTFSNADYTIPSMNNYRSSQEIFQSIIKYENENSLNGFILLTHVGTDPERTDKFYHKLGELIEQLRLKGYQFKKLK